MLEFIVLGQIPGTHLKITFAWCLIVSLILLIWIDLRVHRGHRRHESRASKVDVIHPGQV